jgi:hypothetical protein
MRTIRSTNLELLNRWRAACKILQRQLRRVLGSPADGLWGWFHTARSSPGSTSRRAAHERAIRTW